MKKIISYNYLRTFIIALVVLVGCNPEDNDHLKIPQVVSGGAVKAIVDPDNTFFDVSDLSSTKYVLDLEAYDFENGKLIDSYDIFVSWVDASEGTSSDSIFLQRVTQFPSRIEITPQQIATALELENGIDDLGAGDFFNFTMEVNMKDGRKFTAANTSDDIVLENNARGTFILSTFIGCPAFIRDDLIGTYVVTNDAWEVALPGGSPQVIAGAAENQIIIKDVFNHGLDMVVTFDAQGVATSTRQYTWVPTNWGLPANFGKGYSVGGGRAFSCVGMITLDFAYSVDIGNYPGVWNFTIVKE